MKTDLQCTIIDENCEYSLRELCNLCKVHAQFIQDLIDEGILSPQGQNPQEWKFAAIEIKRIQVSIRLQSDLRINLPGTALALDLLDEIEQLRRSKLRLEQLYTLERKS
jgi:chaperone modulatory protein CbpM